MRGKLRIVVVLAYLLYALVLLGLPLLWWRWGERHWLLIGLCYAPPIFYLLPAIPVMGAAALLRMKEMVLPSVLLLLAIVLGPMNFQFPSLRPPEGGSAFSVLSYNVRAGLGGKEAIAEYLRANGSDLIGLQECRQPMDTRFQDPTSTIEKTMAGYHVARGGIRGELLSLSRFPILSSRDHDLAGYSPVLEIVVDAGGRKLRLLNVHVMTGDPKGVLKGKSAQRTDYLRVSARARHEQTRALLEVLRQSDLPTVLVGDFNSPPGSTLYQGLSRAMQDSFAAKGWGFGMTYSANRPLWRIDYLWASPHLGVESCRVLNSELSDHKPLAGTFRW